MFNRLSGHDFMEKAQDVLTESRDAARTGADEVNAFIHEKPMLATLIGAGAGILLGLLFGGGGRRRTVEVVARSRRVRAVSKGRKHARS